jgi:hypothetical protein
MRTNPLVALALATLASPSFAQDYADTWHCKLNGNIPLGTLTIDRAGNYEMVVAANSLWDPKEGDPGNGVGQLSVAGNMLSPISGPLRDEYGVVGRYSDENRRYIGWASDPTALALFACWPASEVN